MVALIRNEIIKLFSRKKTWIVFICFLLLSGLIAFGLYRESKNMEKMNSPQYKLNMYKENKEYLVKQKSNGDKMNMSDEEIDTRINGLDVKIKTLEEVINSGKSISWKDELKSDIEETEKIINDESMPKRYRERQKLQLKNLKYLSEHNIKPIKSYEFNSLSYIKLLFEVLGAIFLAVGVLVFSSDMVSGESTPPTLKFLLIQPVSRGKVLLSKFIAIVLSSVFLIALSEFIFFIVTGIIGGFAPANYPLLTGTLYQFDKSQVLENGAYQLVEIANSTKMIPAWNYILNMFLMQILFIIAATAFAFLISSIFKSSMVSMSVGIVTIIAISALSGSISYVKKIAHLLFTTYGSSPSVLDGQLALNYNNTNMTPTTGIIVLIVWTIVCYVISHIVFTKKDILI